MSKLFYGSICLTDLNAKAREGHSAFSRAESNGKVYVNINVWDNEEKDKYGNQLGIQLATTKDSPDHEKKIYIGNCKPSERVSGSTAPEPSDIPSEEEEDDLPF